MFRENEIDDRVLPPLTTAASVRPPGEFGGWQRKVRSIVDLQAASNAYLADHNAHPKPFLWTKSTEAILAKLDRCPSVLSV